MREGRPLSIVLKEPHSEKQSWVITAELFVGISSSTNDKAKDSVYQVRGEASCIRK